MANNLLAASKLPTVRCGKMPDSNTRLLEKKNRALQLLQEGRQQEARSLFQEVCKADGNDTGARYMLAVADAQLGDYGAAETGMRQVTKAMPEMADAHFMLGQVLQGQQKLDEAAKSYRKVLSIQPGKPEAHYSLGCVLQSQGDRNGALRCYRQTLQIKPDHVDALTNQGGALQALGKLDAAVASYQKALALRPDLDYLRGALGVALVQQGNQETGLDMLQQGLHINSSRISALQVPTPQDHRTIEPGNLAKAAQSLPDITIATTIAPKNIDNQREAINSWKRLGFNVVSINSAQEIEQLQSSFHDINFIIADRDAKARCGKPYIYFDDFLAYFRTTDSRICSIINSDIHLTDERLKTLVSTEAEDAFLFGCRLDVSSLATTQGTVFRDGFDYFFFDIKYLDVYPENEFCLGLPWWDYWAVLVPMLSQVPVKKLTAPVAHHITHPINWDEDNWKLLSLKIGEYIGMPEQPTIQMLGYCARYIVFLIDKYSEKIALA